MANSKALMTIIRRRDLLKQALLTSFIATLLLFFLFQNTVKKNSNLLAEKQVIRSVDLDESRLRSAVLEHTAIVKQFGEFTHSYKLYGMIFNFNGSFGNLSREFHVPLSSSVIKSFSPGVEEHVKEIFDDEYNECQFMATMPAILKRENGVRVVQRVWLAQYERLKNRLRHEGKSDRGFVNYWMNTWQENYFYEMNLDHEYREVKPGRIMGIPTTTNAFATYKSDGPMDPRIFKIGNDEYISFHSWLATKTNKDDMAGRMHIYDLNRHIKKKLILDRPLQRAEINWIPMDISGELYFTYSLDPLRVLKCNKTSGECKFIYEQEGYEKNPFEYTVDHLRGGTPWLLYKYPYYISVGHNVVVTKYPTNRQSMYNANLIVIRVSPWRVAYVSRSLEFNNSWLKSVPVARNHTIIAPFFYPVGIILQDDDVIDISGHLNDVNGHIIRLSGIKKLMEEVIQKDQMYTTSPSVRTVQQYVMDSHKAQGQPSSTFYGDLRNGAAAEH